MSDSSVVDKFNPFVTSFYEQCCQQLVPYEERGMTNVEGFYIWSLLGLYKPKVVIESGVCKGRSTDIIARACRYFDIPKHYAFDKNDVHAEYIKQKFQDRNVTYEVGDSAELVRNLQQVHADEDIVFVVDGPKKDPQLTELLEVISGFPHVKAIFCHDCRPNKGTREIFATAHQNFFADRLQLCLTNKEMSKPFLRLNDCIAKQLKSLTTKESVDFMASYTGIMYAE
jgi:hypothetical protein